MLCSSWPSSSLSPIGLPVPADPAGSARILPAAAARREGAARKGTKNNVVAARHVGRALPKVRVTRCAGERF